MELVLDPGVLVAAAITPGGVCRQLLDSWLNGEYVLIVSPALLDELEDVLLRSRFRRYLSEEDARRFVHLLAATAKMVADPPPQRGLTPDEDDDYLVALARFVNADALVSGDPHLTTLPDPVPRVLSPRVSLERLARARELQATGDDEPATEGPSSVPWIDWLDKELLPDETAWPYVPRGGWVVVPFAAGAACSSGSAHVTLPMPLAVGLATSLGSATVTSSRLPPASNVGSPARPYA